MSNSKSPNNVKASDAVREAAMEEASAVLQRLGTSQTGLSEAEAATRLVQHGPNAVAQEKHQSWLNRLYVAALNPLVILLTVLAILAFVTGDFRAGTMMVLMVVLGL